VHDHHDEEHAARQAHGRARQSFHKVGRAFTRLARPRGRSKARARASVFLESGGDGFGAGPAVAV